MIKLGMSIAKLTTLGDPLFRFIETTSSPCTLKDIKTRKLAVISIPFAELFGAASPSIATGITTRDLLFDRLHHNSAMNEQYIQQLEALDDRVHEQGASTTTHQTTFVNHSGFIRIERLVKSPIYNNKKKPVAIISYAHNFTQYYDLLSLFDLYQEYYTEAQAIRYFLKYLKVDQHFAELPTYEEMSALLTLYASTLQRQGVTDLKGDTIHKNNTYHQLSSKLKHSSLEEIISLFFEGEIKHN